MSAAGIIVRIIVLVVLFFLLIALFAFAFKVIVAVAAIAGVLLVGYLCFKLYARLFLSKKEEPAATTGGAILKGAGGSIQLFKQEPNLHELIKKEKADLPAPLTEIVPADSEVAVLEEGELAFKIKIKSGSHKGKIGWVDKVHVSR